MNTGDMDLRAILIYWEKRRAVFNAVLLVWGGLWSLPLIDYFGWPASLFYIFVVGLVENLFYCLGPLCEVYAVVLLNRSIGKDRSVLFGLGIAFSVIVVFLTVGVAEFMTFP